MKLSSNRKYEYKFSGGYNISKRPIHRSSAVPSPSLHKETVESVRSVDGVLGFVLASLAQEINQLKETMVELKQEQESIGYQIASMHYEEDHEEKEEKEDGFVNDWGFQNEERERRSRLGHLIDPSLFNPSSSESSIEEEDRQASKRMGSSFQGQGRRNQRDFSSSVGMSLEHLRLAQGAFLPFVLDDTTKVTEPC